MPNRDAASAPCPLVDGLTLIASHHHATHHDCSGGGDLVECHECDFAVEAGRILAPGWVRFTKETADA